MHSRFCQFKKILFSTVIIFISCFFSVYALADDRGPKLFKKCKSCHQIGPDAKNSVGPHLNALNGRIMGSIVGYKYSKAVENMGRLGNSWNSESLNKYLENPRGFIKGTSMKFAGITKESDRLELIDYVFFVSTANALIPSHQDPELDQEILSIEGDYAYGEYLSSECITCHQASGQDNGIPSITNWPVEPFVTALHAYRNNHRKNEIMQMISKRLSDEEIASLAIFFNSLNN